MARLTGLEPATSGVTGRHSNQLSYNRSLYAPASELGLLLGGPRAPVKRDRDDFRRIESGPVARQGGADAPRRLAARECRLNCLINN